MRHIITMFFLLVFFETNSYAGNPFKGDTNYNYILKMFPILIAEGEKQYGDLSVLKGEEYIYCFYYTDCAMYQGTPIIYTKEDFSDENRLSSEKEICSQFIEYANKEVPTGFYFSGNRLSRYILKLYVTSVDPDGETYLYAMIIDTKSKKLIFQKKYNGNRGRFGTLTNLMGDAANRIGKKVGKDFIIALTGQKFK